MACQFIGYFGRSSISVYFVKGYVKSECAFEFSMTIAKVESRIS